MIQIESEVLSVGIAEKGAELQRIRHKQNGLEYLWNGDPAFWGKHSPLLFPIVGTLRDNSYLYRGTRYELPRHGFARERTFEVVSAAGDRAEFLLKSDAETRKVYPFDFALRVTYELTGARLTTRYTVSNEGAGDLYFSIGAHPAFALPLVSGTTYEDYYLQFSQPETLPRWPISATGLIEKKPVPLLTDSDRIELKKSLFYQDAIVFKHPASKRISLRSGKTPHGLDFGLEGFPFLGIWAAKDADFLCLEPWCGIADSVDADQDFTKKEGVERLNPAGSFSRAWTVDLF